MPIDNTPRLEIGGISFTGWTSIRITIGCETVPGSFDIEATEWDPGHNAIGVLPPGGACKVMIGNDLVLTGYVDKYMPSYSPRSRGVRIQGRGRCSDLVDCSVTPDIVQGMSIFTSSFLELANRLGAKFTPPITATSLTGDDIPLITPGTGAPIQFNANIQETPYEILETVARFAGVLIYEGPDGNLLIANVGASSMASGFAEGVNIQAASALFSLDERFSIYYAMLMNTNFYSQEEGGTGQTPLNIAYDRGVPRFRPRVIVSEKFQFGTSFAATLAEWEASRRWGRSNLFKVSCDSWRDSGGQLWRPNAFAPIHAPALNLSDLPEPWVICSVDFIRDARRGTVADLLLMPKEGLAPQPSILVPFRWDPTDGPPAPAGGGANPPSINNEPPLIPTPTGATPTPGGDPVPGSVPYISNTPVPPEPGTVPPQPAGGGAAKGGAGPSGADTATPRPYGTREE